MAAAEDPSRRLRRRHSFDFGLGLRRTEWGLLNPFWKENWELVDRVGCCRSVSGAEDLLYSFGPEFIRFPEDLRRKRVREDERKQFERSYAELAGELDLGWEDEGEEY